MSEIRPTINRRYRVKKKVRLGSARSVADRQPGHRNLTGGPLHILTKKCS